jgi:hypothetical protein
VLAVADEVVDTSADFQVVSLLDVLMFVSTGLMDPRIQIESSFEGQTCLVKGNEAALTETVRGFLENALLSSSENGNFEAAIHSTGKKVMLTLSEQDSGSEWSLQFPEIVLCKSKENNGVPGVIIDSDPHIEENCGFEYMSFEEEDLLAGGQEESVQPDFEHTSS